MNKSYKFVRDHKNSVYTDSCNLINDAMETFLLQPNPHSLYALQTLGSEIQSRLGPTSPVSIMATYSLADAMRQKSFNIEAAECFAELASLLSACGLGIDILAECLQQQAECLYALGDRISAAQKLEECLQIMLRHEIVSSEETIDLLIRQGDYLSENGSFVRAKTVYQRAQDESAKLDELDDRRLLKTITGLARCNKKISLYRIAAIQYEYACAVQARIQQDSPVPPPELQAHTLLSDTAWCLEQSGQKSKAAEYYSRAVVGYNSMVGDFERQISELRFRQVCCLGR